MVERRQPEGSVVARCCSSVVRNFRALATLTAGQLVTSWVRAMITLTEATDIAQRQLDAEQRKATKGVRFRRTCHACYIAWGYAARDSRHRDDI